MAVVKTVKGDPILVGLGEFTTHFRTDFSGWIGGCSLGTGLLTHGHVSPLSSMDIWPPEKPCPSDQRPLAPAKGV